ncbi:MAG: DUF1385 domain-containing protein [Oscillospiraceae bacterium]|nr:DUF1385 domain-containing protein [Oscillospiraceae bacterium]
MSEKNTPCAFRTSIGGQALIEGILMRGPKKQAIVCRTADGLVEKTEELKFIKDRYPVLGWPLIRGCAIFLSSLVNGMKALTFSAEQVPLEEQGEPDKLDLWIEKHFPAEQAQKLIIGTAVVLGIALSVLLFIVLPVEIVSWGFRLIGGIDVTAESSPVSIPVINLCEGVIRIAILLTYMWLVSKVKDVRRLFSYHGAEHKTIFCYEHGKELTVENVRPESRFHPRCGTSFLLVVVIVSILVNSVVTAKNRLLRMLFHLLLLPVVVGVSYEINRWCGGHDNWLSSALSAPGKWLQRITTSEPDDSMIDVAIRALELVIPEEKGSDDWLG